MSTTIVAAPDASLRRACTLAAAFALLVFSLHLACNLYQAHLGYGYFRDEFYYLICGRNLAWGYVDHAPLVALQARLAETLFGHSLAGLRVFAALGGAARIFLTGILAWSLGGKRAAQTLAMLGVLVAPQYLGGDSYLSMNSVESLFWLSCLLSLILMQRRISAQPQLLWLVFGLFAGIGLLNKPSMAIFLIALLFALLLSPQRTLLFTPWAAAGIGLTVLIPSPFLFWQVQHQWPLLEFLHNGQVEHKNVILSPSAFLWAQIQGLHPLTLILWLPGLVWILRRPAWRWLGLTFIFFLVAMELLHAKDYYCMPIYPILFAAGGLAWEQNRTRQPDRAFAFPILESALLLSGLILLPMSNPVLTPLDWIRYAKALYLGDQASKTETSETGPLPQFYADRFGWQEEVDAVRRVYRALSPADQVQTVILCTNYGQASALRFLAPELPLAISGHNNYYLWGPGNRPASILITFERETPEHFHHYYADVQVVAHLTHPWSMPFEHRDLYLLRNPYQTIQSLWSSEKHYI